MGTPPDLSNLQCINTNIVQISPISIPEHLTRCRLLQSPSIPRGLPFSPINPQPQNNTSNTTNTPSTHANTTHTPSCFSTPLTYNALPPFLWHPKTIHKTNQPVLYFQNNSQRNNYTSSLAFDVPNKQPSPNDGKPTDPNYTPHINFAP